MSTESEDRRMAELRIWLEERRLTIQSLSEAAGVSRPFMSVMLTRETMPDKRYRQLVMLGIPEELLPRPFSGSIGRPRKRVEIQPDRVSAGV